MNPPFGHLGWGRENEPIARRFYFEKVESELNLQLFGEEKFSEPTESKADDELVNALWQTMEFDDGWDLRYAERLIYQQELPRGPQNMGNCVGYSHCLALAIRIAHEILLEGDPEVKLGSEETSFVPYIPYSYGAGRCLSGNMCGRGDGSYCSVQLRASQEHGILPSDTKGLSGPFPQPSNSIGRKWGSSTATLNKWKPYAIEYDLEHTYSVEDADKLKKAITEDFMPVQICSNWGFKYRKMENGRAIFSRGGSWAHSMDIVAVYEINGEWYVDVDNQWGKVHKGNYFFTITLDHANEWLKQADARTIGEVKGRKRKDSAPELV